MIDVPRSFLGFAAYLLSACILTSVLFGCETESQSNVSRECARAKSIFQMCYGNCLSRTPGGFVAAAGRCGNVCQEESFDVQDACR
jgi:hypothetical protein